MANTNALKQSPQPLNAWTPQSFTIASGFPGLVPAYTGGYTLASGSFPSKKYRVELADLVGLGAFTSGDIILESLPPGACVTRTLVKPLTAVTGVGTAVGYVKTSGSDYGTTSFNLKTAVSATRFDLATATAAIVSMTAATNLLFHVVVDTTCDAITAGQVDIWVDYVVYSV
jgi:hypothetical protein